MKGITLLSLLILLVSSCSYSSSSGWSFLDSDSVKEAWLKTEVAIKSYHVVERNSNKFNDEKVMQKMAKYE